MTDALGLYKAYWTADEDRAKDPDGRINLALLAITCVAYNGEIPVQIESEYLPQTHARVTEGTAPRLAETLRCCCRIKPSEMDEARLALDIRKQGTLPDDIQRPPGANQGDLYSPGTGEFYDIKGVHSDWPPLNNVRDKSLPFKGAYDLSNNQGWIRKLQDQIVNKGRIVILDTRNTNQAAINDLAAIVKRNGLSDHVVWYP